MGDHPETNILLMKEANRRLKMHRRMELYLEDRSNPLEDLTPEEVKTKYWFYPETILELCKMVYTSLRRKTKRSCALPVLLQVCTALRFLCIGGRYPVIAEAMGVSVSTVFRAVRNFSAVMIGQTNKYIVFPSAASLIAVKKGFYDIARMPNICGAVDGTFVKMLEPSRNAEEFFCRKMFPSLNIQLCCGPDNMIYHSTVKFPGSTHDSYMFENSGLKRLVEDCSKGILLGDNAYGSRPYLFVPVLKERSLEEQRYNIAHRVTRVKIENTIGILKSRFLVLKWVHSRDPQFVAETIQTCLVLHNFATRRRDFINPQIYMEEDKELVEPKDIAPSQNRGDQVRANYIRKHFGPHG